MKNNGNKGSAVVEATLLLPIFIFAMLSLYMMGQCKLAEMAVYEAAVETAEYIAELGYLREGDIITAKSRFEKYIDDDGLVKRYIDGGQGGVYFYDSEYKNEDNQVILKCHFKTVISLPFLPALTSGKSFTIKQMAYVGDCKGDLDSYGDDGGDEYVYITDNKDVYHLTRSCTYLTLSIQQVNIEMAKRYGYAPCEFCGKNCVEVVFITDYGGKYHSTRSCSGLKRTVYRVKKSEVEYLGGCSRCGK